MYDFDNATTLLQNAITSLQDEIKHLSEDASEYEPDDSDYAACIFEANLYRSRLAELKEALAIIRNIETIYDLNDAYNNARRQHAPGVARLVALEPAHIVHKLICSGQEADCIECHYQRTAL